MLCFLAMTYQSARGRQLPVAPPAGHPPILALVVDTEEEFHWGQPFDRQADRVTAMAEIGRFQDLCDNAGVQPCYVVDFPVCARPEGHASLVSYAADGRCEIGAHLHPWVNPPFTEELSAFNSYPGNLPADLEREKLRQLRSRIEAVFGTAPLTYKAGRYGIGPHTTGILHELGFRIDLSTAPGFSYTTDGGPDFRSEGPAPYRFGPGAELLCLPCTGGFTGLLPPAAATRAYFLGERPLFRAASWRGILSRLNLARQARLSPEGYSLERNRVLTEALLRQGVRVFTYSFHSPSLKPGCTSYTRSPADVTAFLSQIRAYLRYFLETLGGTVLRPIQIRDLLVGTRSA